MANWKGIGLSLGKSLLATQGISLGNAGGRGRTPRRRRRRGRGPDYPAILAGFREVLQDELDDEALEGVDQAIVLLAQIIIEERREEEEEDTAESYQGIARGDRLPKQRKKRAPVKKKVKP